MSARDHKRTDGRKIRYAVVGAGWIAQEDFMPGVAHTGNSVLAALVTGDPKKAKELGAMYQIEETCDYAGYDALLKSGKIDAIYLALPNDMHCDFAVRALDAGAHVLCEKPMACTEKECQTMISAARRNKRKLMIAYRLHFEKATLEAIEMVRAGAFGTPRIFSSVHAQQVDPHNHRVISKHWAGPLPDMGPYPINAARQLFGAEPLEVFAFSASLEGDDRFKEVPEMVSVQMRFPEERIAQFVVTYGALAFNQYRIAGTEGNIEVCPGYTWTDELAHRKTMGSENSVTTFPKTDQFGGETKYFSDCILDDVDPEPGGAEGLSDVRVMLAIEKSLATRRPVKVKQTKLSKRPSKDQLEELKSVPPGQMVHAAPADNT